MTCTVILQDKSPTGVTKLSSRLTGGVQLNPSKKKTIEILWYQDWPDMGTITPDNLKMLMEQTNQDPKISTVVHCSAGVGRTGVLLAAILAKKYLPETYNASTFNSYMTVIFLLLRCRRYGAIQNLVQFELLYKPSIY